MKKRLLVVEDNARLLQAISLCLKKADYEVMSARDGGDALIRIAETIPDLIVSDIMMPGADGFSLAAQVRANPRTDLIPIVFLSAKDTRQDRINGFKAGVDAYLVKPFEPEELVAVIENILKRISLTHRRVARATPPSPKKSSNSQFASVSKLTKAEERVAKSVAQSLSNKEIAANLSVSVRTVEMHISNILSKKQFSNRVEIARYIIERDSAE
ncbi:MAG: response regulator transcription factor [Pyrinomonadaceae bacterium]